MARIRTIKPEMGHDEDLATCSAWAQLLAARILCHADDEGYFKAHRALVRASCFPLITDDSLSIQGALTELSRIGYIQLTEGSDGKQYGHITNFRKHQKINRSTPSKIKELCALTESSVSPHCNVTEDTGSTHGPVTETAVSAHGSLGDGSPPEGKGRERKGSITSSGKPDSGAKDKKLSFQPEDMRLAFSIASDLKNAIPNFRAPPKLDGWANDIRLMRELDGRSITEIWDMWRWAHKDPFWASNILSPGKLREKFDQLKAKQLAEAKPKPQHWKNYAETQGIEPKPGEDWPTFERRVKRHMDEGRVH